ncbi:MAG TPA: hypothetical protein GX506_05820 [Firmicutes bacterium]|nr:hypothetical protein [Bacillota bacterium]
MGGMVTRYVAPRLGASRLDARGLWCAPPAVVAVVAGCFFACLVVATGLASAESWQLRGKWTSAVVLTLGDAEIPDWRFESGVEVSLDSKAGNSRTVSNRGFSFDLAAKAPVPAPGIPEGKLGLELDLGLPHDIRLRPGIAVSRKFDPDDFDPDDDMPDTTDTLSGRLRLDWGKKGGAAQLGARWSGAYITYPFRCESRHFKADKTLTLNLVPKTGVFRGMRARIELARASKDYPVKPEISSLTGTTSVEVKMPMTGWLDLTLSGEGRVKDYPGAPARSYRQRAVEGKLAARGIQDILVTLSIGEKDRDYPWSSRKSYVTRSRTVTGKWAPAKALDFELSSGSENREVPGDPAGEYSRKEQELKMGYRISPSLRLSAHAGYVTKAFLHDPQENYSTRVLGLDIAHTIRKGVNMVIQFQRRDKSYPNDPSRAEGEYTFESRISCLI